MRERSHRGGHRGSGTGRTGRAPHAPPCVASCGEPSVVRERDPFHRRGPGARSGGIRRARRCRRRSRGVQGWNERLDTVGRSSRRCYASRSRRRRRPERSCEGESRVTTRPAPDRRPGRRRGMLRVPLMAASARGAVRRADARPTMMANTNVTLDERERIEREHPGRERRNRARDARQQPPPGRVIALGGAPAPPQYRAAEEPEHRDEAEHASLEKSTSHWSSRIGAFAGIEGSWSVVTRVEKPTPRIGLGRTRFGATGPGSRSGPADGRALVGDEAALREERLRQAPERPGTAMWMTTTSGISAGQSRTTSLRRVQSAAMIAAATSARPFARGPEHRRHEQREVRSTSAAAG